MKSEGQKLKLFTLKRILEENTDEHHGLTMQRILEQLSMNGVTAEARASMKILRHWNNCGLRCFRTSTSQPNIGCPAGSFSFPKSSC